MRRGRSPAAEVILPAHITEDYTFQTELDTQDDTNIDDLARQIKQRLGTLPRYVLPVDDYWLRMDTHEGMSAALLRFLRSVSADDIRAERTFPWAPIERNGECKCSKCIFLGDPMVEDQFCENGHFEYVVRICIERFASQRKRRRKRERG